MTALALPERRRYPMSDRSPRIAWACAASVALHMMLASLITIWLRRLPPPPGQPEQPVEIIFQAQEAAPVLPGMPTVTTEPPRETPPVPDPETPPPIALTPPPPPAEPAPPAVPVPQPPLVDMAPSIPPVSALTPPAQMAPMSAPKPPSVPVRPQPRSITTAHSPTPRQAPPAAPNAPEPVERSLPPSAALSASISADWQKALSAWLSAHKNYPEAARRRGEQGSVALRFTVERSGRVDDVAVVQGSGSPALDAAAGSLLRGAALPAFPGTMQQDKVTVTVRLRFTLTE